MGEGAGDAGADGPDLRGMLAVYEEARRALVWGRRLWREHSMQMLDVRAISAAETRPLRGAILRPGQSPEQLVYPHDDEPDTLHAGAFHGGRLVGIASVARNPCLRHSFAEPWQLRGMATAPEVRGQGYGRALIELCAAHIAGHGGRTLWCNGRTTAKGFYERLGFTPVGEEFVTQTGPHYVFFRPVAGGSMPPGSARESGR